MFRRLTRIKDRTPEITMTKFILLQLILAAALIMGSTDAAVAGAPADLNLDGNGVALQGYDPVSYHVQGPVPGKPEFSTTHEGAIYHFSSRENLQLFIDEPETYLPAFGGWCAWAMLDGEKVEVDPETYKIVDDSTYLFYNTFFVNTLSKWNRLAEKESEAALVKRAQARWSELIEKAAPSKTNESNKY
jgi:YHS domain-containing protein